MYRVVNIKENNPNADYAMFLLDEEIRYSKATGNRVIIIIHGYGSHGEGGIIKQALIKYLNILLKTHIIESFVLGENWGEFNETRKKICVVAPEIILTENLQMLNSGVSVVLLP